MVDGSYMGSAEFSFSTLPSHTSTNSPTKPPTPTPPAAPSVTVQHIFFSLHVVAGCGFQKRHTFVAASRRDPSCHAGTSTSCRQSAAQPNTIPHHGRLPARYCFSKPLHEAGRQGQKGIVCRSNSFPLCAAWLMPATVCGKPRPGPKSFASLPGGTRFQTVPCGLE